MTDDIKAAVNIVQTMKNVINALEPFAKAIEEAEKVISPTAKDRYSHVIHRTAYFLSYDNFAKAKKIIDEIKERT